MDPRVEPGGRDKAGGASIQSDHALGVWAEPEGLADAVAGSSTQHNLIAADVARRCICSKSAAKIGCIQSLGSPGTDATPQIATTTPQLHDNRCAHRRVNRTVLATITYHFDKFMMRRAAMIQSSTIGLVDGVWTVSEYLPPVAKHPPARPCSKSNNFGRRGRRSGKRVTGRPLRHDSGGVRCDRPRRQRCAWNDAKPRVPDPRGEQPERLAANEAGCARIPLRCASMRRKIALNSPGIWGISAKMAPQLLSRVSPGLQA